MAADARRSALTEKIKTFLNSSMSYPPESLIFEGIGCRPNPASHRSTSFHDSCLFTGIGSQHFIGEFKPSRYRGLFILGIWKLSISAGGGLEDESGLPRLVSFR